MTRLRVIIEPSPRFQMADLVRGSTYIIRKSRNVLIHAVYLRADRVYKVILGVRRNYATTLYVFRDSASGQEIFIHARQLNRSVIKEVTGIEGLIMAGDIEL